MKPVFSPQSSGETEPAPKASGETETSPEPSGEAELPQRRRARRNQTPVLRARDATAPLSVQKFLSFDGYWFHLLGYPGIRSPTGGQAGAAWRVTPRSQRAKDAKLLEIEEARGGGGEDKEVNSAKYILYHS